VSVKRGLLQAADGGTVVKATLRAPTDTVLRVEDVSNWLSGDFEAVLEYLKESRGLDFTGYKRASLARRVRRRMTQVGIDDYAEYLDHLRVNADEINALSSVNLFNVTGFFRDPEAWEALRSDLIPALLARRSPDEQVRIWSAGCASGEEAYTLAMVFAEVIGPDRFRQRVKIYATDVDEDALVRARHAVYPENAVKAVPPEMVSTYFERQGRQFVFRKNLRRSVIFGRNDLVQDAPISHIDLLVCRNTLMYFNAQTQSKVLSRLHFALAPKGLLFLGKAEMLLPPSGIFDPVDLKCSVFRKTTVAPVNLAHFSARSFTRGRIGEIGGLDKLRDRALAAAPVAQVVVTGEDVVALINKRAELMFGLSDKNVGRPLRELDLYYRPVELSTYVKRAKAERRANQIKDVEWRRGRDESMWLEVHVNPLVDAGNRLLGVSIDYHDITATRTVLDELMAVKRQRELVYEVVDPTREEVDTTNELLLSTVEELETTKEELQSANTELEPANEQLRSANDELQASNATLRERALELGKANELLKAVLISVRSGVAVVDKEMRVVLWNRGAEYLWGLRQDEAIGQPLPDLDIGVPVSALNSIVRAALQDVDFEETMLVQAVNRRGRTTVVRLRCGPLLAPNGDIRGSTLLMETEDGHI
jgi:two-component system, chemotaxis family, CheB/CheR fusion protein